MAFSIGFALCGDPKIVTKTYKDKVADKYEGLIEEKLCIFQPALAGEEWRKLKTVKEMNDLVLTYLLVGDGSAPFFKWFSRIALDMQMAKWRIEFKDTDYGIRPSSMPALLPQSHHLLDVLYLPSSTTSPKKATGSSNEPRTNSG
mmetsp:Transcript_57755/g.116054  ORF Transcript_57755/g.116054 Transcript_57755/m.116054 type:complete len:145 (+) Transcript_57755:208-642(+)